MIESRLAAIRAADPALDCVRIKSRTPKLADTGLLLGKKSRLSGRIFGVAKVAQADANEAEPLVRAEGDTF